MESEHREEDAVFWNQISYSLFLLLQFGCAAASQNAPEMLWLWFLGQTAEDRCQQLSGKSCCWADWFYIRDYPSLC